MAAEDTAVSRQCCCRGPRSRSPVYVPAPSRLCRSAAVAAEDTAVSRQCCCKALSEPGTDRSPDPAIPSRPPAALVPVSRPPQVLAGSTLNLDSVVRPTHFLCELLVHNGLWSMAEWHALRAGTLGLATADPYTSCEPRESNNCGNQVEGTCHSATNHALRRQPLGVRRKAASARLPRSARLPDRDPMAA